MKKDFRVELEATYFTMLYIVFNNIWTWIHPLRIQNSFWKRNTDASPWFDWPNATFHYCCFNNAFYLIILEIKWVCLAQTASWGSEIWPWYIILWIHKMVMDHTDPTEKSVCHLSAFSTLCSCCSAIRQLWWVLGGRHGPYLKWL